MDKKRTYYQPYVYFDDGTNIQWIFPEDLLDSNQAFASVEDCEEFMDRNGYGIGEVSVMQFHDDDIKDVVIIDADGNRIDQ